MNTDKLKELALAHTPEPWEVGDIDFDNEGFPETVIQGLNGRAAIAVALDFGKNNPEMREANARRIVACVNACSGLDIEMLEAIPGGNEKIMPRYTAMQAQRDELLAALKELGYRVKGE